MTQAVLRRAKIWSVAVIGALAALLAATPILHRSAPLTAFSDLTQCLLLLSGTVVFIPHAIKSHGRLRLFWILLSMGVGFWLGYQLLWTYIEVALHQDVPSLFSGDIILFLHLVPIIAAIALRPHIQPDEYAARVGRLDFALLLVWWIYLYIFLVMSWQYAVPKEAAYNQNLNALYLVEKVTLLIALTACCATSRGAWRLFYANLFGATLIYATSSYIANWAIANATYFSGSWYDIPLATSMAWLTMIGLWSNASAPQGGLGRVFSAYGVWVARGGMIATFSLPLFAAWAISDHSVPSTVRTFRVIVTLASALIMSIMVFVRQRLLDRELTRLLQQSRESVDNLKQLQEQVLHQEKLASIGQLVGGAAHELNNPITAMLGYSELLLSTPMSSAEKDLASKITQNVRRTKSLVAGLLSFARKTPTAHASVDLNTMLRTAIKLSEAQCQTLKVDVRMDLDTALPRIIGDSNQLLQLCVQLVNNALHALTEGTHRHLSISTRGQNGTCILQIAYGTPGAAPLTSVAILPETIGLTACLGIVQEHQGIISCEQFQNRGSIIRIELPTNAPAAHLKVSAAAATALS